MMQLAVIRWPGGPLPAQTDLIRQLEGDGYAAYEWHDTVGADYPPHSHDHNECIWVLAGSIVFGAGGREWRLHAGDRLMLPKGTIHTARVPSEPAHYIIGEQA